MHRDLSGADITSLRFTDAAQESFNAWRENFERRFLTEEMPPALEAHLTKYRSLLPSLALIFHLIDTPDDSAVGVEHVRRRKAGSYIWRPTRGGYTRKSWTLA